MIIVERVANCKLSHSLSLSLSLYYVFSLFLSLLYQLRKVDISLYVMELLRYHDNYIDSEMDSLVHKNSATKDLIYNVLFIFYFLVACCPK